MKLKLFVCVGAQTIDWDALDSVPPEWDTGLDDLLSLSTTYWEPGLGPRDTRKVGTTNRPTYGRTGSKGSYTSNN